MESSKTISIITINLNNKKGLIKTVESVVKQTYTSLEYIVIDGGSTDGSKEYVYSQASKLVYWESQPDSGIYAAMNKGLQQAKGEYCLFLNSGDWLLTDDVLEKVFSEIHVEDILICGCQISLAGTIINTISPPNEISLLSILKSSLPHQATFIKKKLFELTGLYSESYKIHSDFEFWLRTIILNNTTYNSVDVVVSDYNLEGVSALDSNRVASQTEIRSILSSALPERVIVDYYKWIGQQEQFEFELFDWLSSKPRLLSCLLRFYKFIKAASAFRKRMLQYV